MAEWQRNQGETEPQDKEIACESEKLFQAIKELVLSEAADGKRRRRSLLHIYTSL